MSSSSSSTASHYSSDEEEEPVSKAVSLVANVVQQSVIPPRPVFTRKRIERDRVAANTRLMHDYFVDKPCYPNPKTSRRRFQMSKRLFYVPLTTWNNDFIISIKEVIVRAMLDSRPYKSVHRRYMSSRSGTQPTSTTSI
jgi:hypothetical protein